MSNNFPYKTFGGWVRSHGIKISDIPEELLPMAKDEYEKLKNGVRLLDGVVSEIAFHHKLTKDI